MYLTRSRLNIIRATALHCDELLERRNNILPRNTGPTVIYDSRIAAGVPRLSRSLFAVRIFSVTHVRARSASSVS